LEAQFAELTMAMIAARNAPESFGHAATIFDPICLISAGC
jgi:hypothetical protein